MGKIRKAYLAISFSNRYLFDHEIIALKQCLEQNNIELLVFVDEYNFKVTQEKVMMKMAFKEIDDSDFLIAELTTKSIGVGIELGYAFAQKKPIFYIRKEGSEYSTTASGSSTHVIEYKNGSNLCELIKRLLGSLANHKQQIHD